MHCRSRAVHLLLLAPRKPGIRDEEKGNGNAKEQSRNKVNVPKIEQQPYQHQRSQDRHVPSRSPDENPKLLHRKALGVENVLLGNFVIDFHMTDFSKAHSTPVDLSREPAYHSGPQANVKADCGRFPWKTRSYRDGAWCNLVLERLPARV